jgi:hypothetical protein
MESLVADMLAKCYYHKQKRLAERSSESAHPIDFDGMI